MAEKKLGLIVNPIAGMGGKVGLKGSDGEAILERAIVLGAIPVSPTRAVEALKRLHPIKDEVMMLAASGDMGETEAKECGFAPVVMSSTGSGVKTTAEDTKHAAGRMLDVGIDLLLFVGGDGTARDIYESVGDRAVVLGVPAGVKIHSGVYAVNPRSAGDLAVMYLKGERTEIREAEVMDIDEDAFRENRLSARLYGYLKVPHEQSLVQNAKAGSPVIDADSIEEIATYLVENMDDGWVYVVGPGTTTRPIVEKLGLSKTLLGVDIVGSGKMLASDANEEKILQVMRGRKAKVIVSVIGGQGFVLGRGSQQISPEVIRAVGRENIIIVCTPAKLASLGGKPLLVDTGDPEVDSMLSGYHKVVTGYGRRAAYLVRSP